MFNGLFSIYELNWYRSIENITFILLNV